MAVDLSELGFAEEDAKLVLSVLENQDFENALSAVIVAKLEGSIEGDCFGSQLAASIYRRGIAIAKKDNSILELKRKLTGLRRDIRTYIMQNAGFYIFHFADESDAGRVASFAEELVALGIVSQGKMDNLRYSDSPDVNMTRIAKITMKYFGGLVEEGFNVESPEERFSFSQKVRQGSRGDVIRKMMAELNAYLNVFKAVSALLLETEKKTEIEEARDKTSESLKAVADSDSSLEHSIKRMTEHMPVLEENGFYHAFSVVEDLINFDSDDIRTIRRKADSYRTKLRKLIRTGPGRVIFIPMKRCGGIVGSELLDYSDKPGYSPLVILRTQLEQALFAKGIVSQDDIEGWRTWTPKVYNALVTRYPESVDHESSTIEDGTLEVDLGANTIKAVYYEVHYLLLALHIMEYKLNDALDARKAKVKAKQKSARKSNTAAVQLVDAEQDSDSALECSDVEPLEGKRVLVCVLPGGECSKGIVPGLAEKGCEAVCIESDDSFNYRAALQKQVNEAGDFDCVLVVGGDYVNDAPVDHNEAEPGLQRECVFFHKFLSHRGIDPIFVSGRFGRSSVVQMMESHFSC